MTSSLNSWSLNSALRTSCETKRLPPPLLPPSLHHYSISHNSFTILLIPLSPTRLIMTSAKCSRTGMAKGQTSGSELSWNTTDENASVTAEFIRSSPLPKSDHWRIVINYSQRRALRGKWGSCVSRETPRRDSKAPEGAEEMMQVTGSVKWLGRR